MFIDMLSLPNFDEFDLTSLYTGISCSLNTIVSPSASEFISDFRCMCKPFFSFSFIVYYRVLLLFLFMACQWHCPLPDI